MGQLATLGFIAMGGAFGACSRYLLSELCAQLFGRSFPYGTLTVNILGSLMMGILIGLFESGVIASEPWRQIIGIGFLGALTTFSTFSMDNVFLLQQGDYLKVGLNILLNVVLSISVAMIGYHLVTKS
jgi:CrcB protein